MTEAWLGTMVLTIPLAILVVFDLQVAIRVHRSAVIRPRSRFLSLVSLIVNGIAIGATIGALLGVQSVVFYLWNVRLLPQPLPLVGIYIAVVSASIALIPLRRQIGKWDREIPPDPPEDEQ